MPAVSRSYSLDNAAKAWPTVLSHRQTSRFRLFAVFRKPLVSHILTEALQLTEKRYPWFLVRLKAGFFWYHLESISGSLPLVPDFTPPCLIPESSPKNQSLLTVHVYHRTLGVEASHVLTDGSGLSEFFRTLISVYLHCLLGDQNPIQRGNTTDFLLGDWGTVRRPGEPYTSEEWVDEFVEQHLTGLPSPSVPSKALHLPVSLLPEGEYRVCHALIPVSALKEKTAAKRVSLGEYLSAVVLMAFQQCVEDVPKRHRKSLIRNPLRLLVPIDLRRLYKSRTLRNFLVGMAVELDLRLGHYSFDEILTRVHHVQRTELDQKYLRRQVSRNVRGESVMFLRIMPLIFKNPVLKWVFLNFGDRRHTASFSNLGSIDLPQGAEEQVDWIGMIPPPGVISPINVTAISYKDTLCLTVGKSTGYSRFEYHLFRFFADQGITPKVFTNFSGG